MCLLTGELTLAIRCILRSCEWCDGRVVRVKHARCCAQWLDDIQRGRPVHSCCRRAQYSSGSEGRRRPRQARRKEGGARAAVVAL